MSKQLTQKLTHMLLPVLLFMGLSTSALADAPALYKPAVAPSFGPNGTHWPSQIPTPFMFDLSVPHVIDVVCDWAAIQTAIKSVTDEMAAEGVLIRVAPGDLVGKGSSATDDNTRVIKDCGSATWTRRVTVAPRDGVGTVRITTSTAGFARVKGVCLSGFVGNGIMLIQCENSAVAWSKVGTLYIYTHTSAASTNTPGMEFAELVVEPTLLGATIVNSDRLRLSNQGNNFHGVRLVNSGTVTNAIFDGCYVTPMFNANQSNTVAIFFDGGQAGIYKNITFKDTAAFAGIDGVVRTSPYVDGLTFDHSLVAAGQASTDRYPVPTGASTASYRAQYAFAATGTVSNGTNVSVVNSAVSGSISMSAPDIFSSVSNTIIDASIAASAPAPASGGWGAPNIGDTKSVDDIKAMWPPEPTDDYLWGASGVWSIGSAPIITTQPVGPAGAQAAGKDITLAVVATGKFLAYQWQKDGVDIAGANAATYTISNPSSDATGSYTVKVLNAVGTATSDSVAITVTGTALYRPAVVSSFGPNGTHWPSKISTPFMYDYSVPHVREVECDWDAIKAAINAVTPEEAAEGVLILVKPGELPGKGASAGVPSTANCVIMNAGSKDWTRRVTLAPRDGIGSVILGTETTSISRLFRVHGVCFAGFVGKGFMLSDCSNSAIAWSALGYLFVHSRDDANGMEAANNEFVEVVFDISLWSGNADRISQVNATFPLRLLTQKAYDNASFEGCYVKPLFRNTATGILASTYSINFEGGINTNTVIKDTAIFAGTDGALRGTDNVRDLTIEHSYIVADPVSTARYPVPAASGALDISALKTITGSGTGFALNNSVVAGDIDFVLSSADTTTSAFASVTNTIVDRLHAGPAQVPASGAWGVPAGETTSAAAIIDMMPPDATPEYLYSGADAVWRFTHPAPVIETGLDATTTANAGETVTLTVTVSADSKFVGYQWTKDGVAIPGATSASLTLPSATAADSGSYTVTVSNAAGSATSTSAVTVGGPPPKQLPVITTQPQSASVNAGQPFSLSVTATDPLGGTLTYAWYKDGTAISGATTATIGKASVATGDAGTYYVEVTNADGVTTSDDAVITVIANTTPTIPVQPPGSRVALEGGSLTLTASYAGTPAPTVKWQVSTNGGTTWEYVSLSDPAYSIGADSLTILAATTGMNGWMYRYVLENSEGTLTSGSTTITINSGELYAPVEVPSRGPNGTHWPKTIPTPFMYDLTVPHVIEVDCTWAAIQTALNAVTDDMAAEGVLIRVKPGVLYGTYAGTSTGGTNVKIGYVGSSTWPMRVTVAPRDGFGSVTLQREETNPKKGSFLIANVKNVCFAGFDAAAMSFRQCSGLALAWSQTGYLDVFNYQDPPEHTADIELVEVFVDPALNPDTADRRRTTAGLRMYNGGSLNNVSVVGSYVAAVFYSGSSTVPSALSMPNVAAVTGNPDPVTQNIKIKDSAIFASTDYSLSIPNLDGLAIDNSYIVAGDVSVARYAIPANAGIPSGASATAHKRAMGGRGKNITVANSVIAGEVSMTAVDAPYPIQSVTNTYVDRTHASASNPETGGWGVPAGSASAVATLVGMMPAEPTDAAVPGTPDPTKTYLKQIWNVSAPVLTSQPPPLSAATAGQNITLSVTVQDSLLVVYQWSKDGVPIPDATQSSYTINGIGVEDAGLYTVSVSNGGGTVVASTQVTVGEDPNHPLPVITTQPAASTSALAGTPITLSVVAENPPPATGSLSYQWYKEGVLIGGKTASTLTLAGVPADAGSYTVRVTNVNGIRTSAIAVVEVTGIPAGAAVPLPNVLSKLVADSITLTATTVGNPPPTIKWQYSTDNGGTWIDVSPSDARFTGADTATFTILSLSLDLDGWRFRYVAENPFGPAHSNNTRLQVLTEYPPFYNPTEISSFGPNGTHWPSLISTPFMYDVTIPNRIEVECTWAAIKTAIETVMANESMVAAGTVILIKPGNLIGDGSNTVVLQNLGSKTWPRRITVAPRDGYGTVKIVKSSNPDQLGGARFNNVHGICFAGLETGSLRPSGCVNMAIAWTKLTSWMGITAPAGADSSGVEMVEVALTDFAVLDDDSAQLAGDSSSTMENVHIVGSYFAPHYRSTGAAHCDTLQIHTVKARDIHFRDTAMFASSNTALQTGDVQGLTVRHCYFAALAPALHRYPYPTGYTPPNPDDVGKTFNGGGSGFKVYDNIFIGRLTGMDGKWSVVENTRSTASSALASGGTGAWTVDATLTSTTPEDFNVPLPTDDYLGGIWKAVAPGITEQPVGGILQSGVTHTFRVSVNGTKTFFYQWYKDGVAIPYANDPEFVIDEVATANNGIYKVVVTNAGGSVTSDEVELEVDDAKVAPSVSESPVATQNAIAGKSVSFSGSATGNPAPAYRWQVATSGNNWTDIDPSDPDYSGADTGTLTAVNPTAGMNGYKYRYVATNSMGSIESAASTLAVTAAALNLPVGIVSDAAGTLYVSDAGAHTIHRLTSTGTLQIIAGATGTAGMADGIRAEALFDTPAGLAVRSGTLYIADAGNSAIRGLTGSGTVTTIVASTAGLKNAEGVAVAANGTLYIADTGNHVIRVYASGSLSTLAGTINATGTTDGAGADARFNHPTRLALAANGALYVADTGNAAIRVIAPSTGNVVTLTDAADGLFAPSGLLVSASGTDTIVYVADAGNSTISEVAPNGTVATLAGYGGIDDIAGPPGFKDGVNQGAWFNMPEDVTVGTDGALYVADTGNSVIRKVTFDDSDNATATTLKPTVVPIEPQPADIGPFNPGSSSAGGAPSAWYLALLAAFAFMGLARSRRDRK